jgi:hypothetical protein
MVTEILQSLHNLEPGDMRQQSLAVLGEGVSSPCNVLIRTDQHQRRFVQLLRFRSLHIDDLEGDLSCNGGPLDRRDRIVCPPVESLVSIGNVSEVRCRTELT